MPRLFMPRLRRFRFGVASLLLLFGLSVILTARPANAAPSGLTYLGQLLVGGAPVTGNYDFQFQLYDAATGGNQVGSTVSLTSVRVADGVYYASLFFGTGVITGQTLWLQISYRVHPSSGNPAYTTQSPRNVAPNSAFASYAILSGSTAALQGKPVSTIAPTSGQTLTWNGSLWAPATPSGGGGGSYSAGTGLSLSGTTFSVATGGITSSLLANGSVSGAKLALPLSASVSSSSDLFTLSNTGSGRAIVGNSTSNTAVKGVGYNGVYGQGTNYGVQASGTNYGVYAVSGGSSGIGVYGKSTNSTGVEGIYGAASSLSTNYFPSAVLGDTNVGNGVIGVTSAGSGYGVLGVTGANGAVGVYGVTANTSGYGVEGIGGAYGIYGSGTSYGLYGSGGTYGVYGNGSSYGVYGNSNVNYGVYGNSTNGNYGVVGNSGHGYGVYGNGPVAGVYANSTNIGVYGKGPYGVVGEGTTSAGYFYGDVYVSGNLSKAGGSFKIDDPIDPANKFLSHSFVESPDMMNIYNGNITTDANGDATVTMPKWFGALNQDFRYQLTVIGQFAQAIVATEIEKNQFTVKTDKPSVKVSWQVTGIRHDAWADAHRIPTEEDKPEDEQGLYLHPKEFGMPESLAIVPTRQGANALPVPPPGGAASAPKPPTQGAQHQ